MPARKQKPAPEPERYQRFRPNRRVRNSQVKRVAVSFGLLTALCRLAKFDRDFDKWCKSANPVASRPPSELDVFKILAPLRAMNLELHGSCTVPVAGYCIEVEQGLALWGLVGDATNGTLVRADAVGAADEPEALGRRVAALLFERGAGEILRAF